MSDENDTTKGAPRKGGRPRRGTVIPLPDGRLQPVITLPDGSRKRMKPLPLGTSRAMADEKAAYFTELAEKVGAKRPAKEAPTSAGTEWWDAFFRHRDAKGMSPTRPLYNANLAPTVPEHPRDWTRETAERLVRALDERIAAGLSWKTAANAWGLFTKAAKVACSAKSPPALRVRKDNPCAGVEGPDRGERKAKQWVYPVEAERLLAADDATIPLRWKRLYALLAYTYMRPGELHALTWDDVSLEGGTIHVTKAWDYKRGKLGPPKTSAGIRKIPIEATLRPLLELMRGEGDGTGPVILMPRMEHWARALRRHLKAAGVSRPDLFIDTPTTKQITLYDLRASGITWRCLREDYPKKIQRAAGHEKPTTTDIYIRTAEEAGHVGSPFPPLPPSLIGDEFRSGFRSVDDEAKTNQSVTVPTEGLENVGERDDADKRVASLDSEAKSASDDESKSAKSGHRSNAPNASIESPDAVEAALADALQRAALAGAWDAVASLTAELKARREARARVVSLDAERSRRGGRP